MNVVGGLQNNSVMYTFERSFWVDAPVGSTYNCSLSLSAIQDDKLDGVYLVNGLGVTSMGLSTNMFASCNTNTGGMFPVVLTGGENKLRFDVLCRQFDPFGPVDYSPMYLAANANISYAGPGPDIFIKNDYYVPNATAWGCALSGFSPFPPVPTYAVSCVELPNTTGQLTIINYNPVFNYSINNGGIISPTGVITTQSGTTYTVTVSDAKGCSVTSTAQLNAAPPMVYTLSPAHSCLAQGSMQTLFSTVTGGTPGFMFGYPGSNPSGNVYITSPGVYSVTVVDQHGCFATATATVGNRFDVQLTANNPCMNANGGASVITASTNPAIAGVQYSIDGINFTLNNQFTVTMPGIYTIAAVDPYNCTSTGTIEVWTNPIPFVNSDGVDCFPTLTVANTLPTTLVTAAWSDPINQISWTPPPFNFTPQNIVPVPLPFSYTVTVTDVNGCTGTATYLYSPNPFCCDNYQNISLAGNYFSSHPTYGNGTASAISAAFGGNTITTNAPIYLDGDILIDQSISFVNCPDIRLTYNTRLLLAPGVTLTIDQSTLQAKCGYMWKGIYATGTANTLHITASSLFDMQEGVVADLGASIHCTGNYFERNYYSMQLKNAPAAYNAAALNCIITGNTFSGNANMLYPYNNQPKSETAIRVQNCREVQIGQLANVNGGNNFYGGYNGIHIIPGANTQVESYYLYNNLFWSMYETVNSSPTVLYYKVNAWSTANHRGAGVYCKPLGSTPSANHHLYIEADQEGFQFDRCDRAVCAFETGADIKGNTVKTCVMGFLFPVAKNHKYTIQNNSLAGNQWSSTGFLDYGVLGIRFLGGPAFAMVQNNGIDMGPYAGVSNQGAKIFPVAIDLIGTGGGTSATVMENNITLQMPSGCGISVRNFSSGVDLYQNTINNYSNGLFGDPTYVSAGIFCENAQRVKIRGNNINGNNDLLSNPNAYDAIRMSASTDCLVECNETYATRRGLRVYSNCSTGPQMVRGNTFDTQGYAMEFNDLGTIGTFGDIGEPGYDCRNEFFNSALFPPNTYGIFRNVTVPGFGGDIFTIFAPTTYSWSDQPGGLGKYNIMPNPGADNYTCPQTMYQLTGIPQGSGGAPMSMQAALEIALDSAEYPQFQESVSWLEKQRLFNALSGPDSILLSNAELAQFYSDQLLQYSDELRNINQLIKTLGDSTVYGDSLQYAIRLQEIEALNNAIGGNNSLELNEKLINQLLVQWLRGDLALLSSSDATMIENMANSCPFVNGNGVYKARLLLYGLGSFSGHTDKHLCNAVGMFKNADGDEEPQIGFDQLRGKVEGVSVYPNPFTEEVNLEFEGVVKDVATFRLFDVSGRELFQQFIDGKARRIRINLPVLNPGVYMYRIDGHLDTETFYGKLIKE